MPRKAVAASQKAEAEWCPLAGTETGAALARWASSRQPQRRPAGACQTRARGTPDGAESVPAAQALPELCAAEVAPAVSLVLRLAAAVRGAHHPAEARADARADAPGAAAGAAGEGRRDYLAAAAAGVRARVRALGGTGAEAAAAGEALRGAARAHAGVAAALLADVEAGQRQARARRGGGCLTGRRGGAALAAGSPLSSGCSSRPVRACAKHWARHRSQAEPLSEQCTGLVPRLQQRMPPQGQPRRDADGGREASTPACSCFQSSAA